MSPVLFAFLAVLALSLDNIVWKYTIDRDVCPVASLIFYHIVAIFLLLPITGVPIPYEAGWFEWTLLFTSCGLWVVGDYLGVRAYEYLDASVCSVYKKLQLVLVAIAGVVLFGESLGVLSLAGIALILFAVLFQLDLRNLTWNKGACFQFAAVFFHTGALIIDKILTGYVSEMTIVFYGFLLPAIIYSSVGAGKFKNIVPLIKKSRGVFLLAPVFGSISYFFFILAISRGSLAVTYTIQETGIILILLLEMVILNAYQNLVRKMVSCGACAVGAVLLCGIV